MPEARDIPGLLLLVAALLESILTPGGWKMIGIAWLILGAAYLLLMLPMRKRLENRDLRDRRLVSWIADAGWGPVCIPSSINMLSPHQDPQDENHW